MTEALTKIDASVIIYERKRRMNERNVYMDV